MIIIVDNQLAELSPVYAHVVVPRKISYSRIYGIRLCVDQMSFFSRNLKPPDLPIYSLL